MDMRLLLLILYILREQDENADTIEEFMRLHLYGIVQLEFSILTEENTINDLINNTSAFNNNTATSIFVLPPDLQGNVKGARETLGSAWGDPAFMAKRLTPWENEIRKIIHGEFKRICDTEMSMKERIVNKSYCPCFGKKLQGYVPIEWDPPSWETMAGIYSNQGVLIGGERPLYEDCSVRQKVAIIIPYRDRQNQIHLFINHIHKILLRQNFHYRIFVIEQSHPNIFNKASLMDIAFLEARKLFDMDCVIFHDVDLLLEDDRNIYACAKSPRHIASHVDKHFYRLPYQTLFGGSTAFRTDQFTQINGYATTYWGWGGEDDDMFQRVARRLRMRPYRLPAAISRFTMVKHTRENSFPENIFKNKLVKNRFIFEASISKDGLSSIKYKIHKLEFRPLFTWILAEFESSLTSFYNEPGSCVTNATSYSSREESLPNCAEICLNDGRCNMFEFHFDARFHPWCRLFEYNCEISDLKLEHWYIYTKGRVW